MDEPSSILSNFVNTAITSLIDRPVVVRLSDDSGFSGILQTFTPGQSIVLRDATMIKAGFGKSDEINSDSKPTFELLMNKITHVVDSNVSSDYERHIAAFRIKESKLNRNAKEFFPALKKHSATNFMVGPQMSCTGYMQNNYRQIPHGNFENFGPAHEFPQTNFGPVGNMMMQPARFPDQYYGAQTGPYLPMNPQFGMTQGVSDYGPPTFYPAPHHIQFPISQGFAQGQALQQPYLGPSAGPAGPPFYPVPHHQFQAPGPNGFINSNFW